MFLAEFLIIIARGWSFSTIFLPQGSGFRTFLCSGGGGWNSPFQKVPPGFCWEGGGGGGDGQAWN